MNNSTLISIIIPCYNSEQTIARCLDSLLTQDYRNLEIIIVNDGSTDTTGRILEDYTNRDNRISVLEQTNHGVAYARNIGVKKASGSFICFVDADDYVDPMYCSTMLQNMQNHDADISIVEVIYEDDKGKELYSTDYNQAIEIYSKEEGLDLLLLDEKIKSYPCAKLYKAHLLKEVTFPEHLEAFEDYFTLFKVFYKAQKVVKQNYGLYHYIQYDNSLSHNLTPQRAYHFFLALNEAYSFQSSKKLNIKSKNNIVRNILKKIFMVLKRLLRNTSPDEMITEKEHIRNQLRHFLPYTIKDIGLEYFVYLRLFIYSPKIYNTLIARK